MTSGFQQTVNLQPAPAVEGDFASSNPRASMIALQGALTSAAAGVTVGKFAWALAGVLSNAFQVGGDIGFIHREQQALITAFLGQTSMVVPQGYQVTAMKSGDYWGRFAGGATYGQKVYAAYADGSLSAAATGTPNTNTGTVSTATNTTLTVTTAPALPIAIGQPVSGAGIAAGTYISAFGTGTGGLGTYTLSQATTATASGVTATFTTNVETNFYVRSTAANGELAVISTYQ